MRLSAIAFLATTALLLTTHRADAAFGRDKAPRATTPHATTPRATTPQARTATRPQRAQRAGINVAKGAAIGVGLLATAVIAPHALATLQGTAETVDHHALWHIPATFAAYGGIRMVKPLIKDQFSRLRGKFGGGKAGESAHASAP